jgi:hypothetical protein
MHTKFLWGILMVKQEIYAWRRVSKIILKETK